MGAGLSVDQVRAHAQEAPCNILLLGEAQHGKSSLVNTIYSALTQRRVIIAPPGNGQTTTRAYRRHNIGYGVNLFDMTGFAFAEEAQKALLLKLLAGVSTPSSLPDAPDNNTLLERISQLQIDPNNAIDFVIWVVNAKEIQSDSKGFLWRTLTVPSDRSRQYFRDVGQLIQQHSKLNFGPTFVFTHIDQSNLSESTITSGVFNWLGASEKYCIHCYTNHGEHRAHTDQTALTIVYHLALRKATML